MPGEVPREELDLRPNREVLSPPYLVEPLYQCAISMTVRGFEPHAELDVDVDGTITTEQADFPHPHGHTMMLGAALSAGQQVRVRQRTPEAESGWSVPVVVGDHTVDYPHGPPRPVINPAPVYACGSRTGVRNILPGGTVWITADDGATVDEVGRVDGCSEHQGVDVNPDYSLNDMVSAHYELCDDPSAPSEAHTAAAPPAPLPAPSVPNPIEEGEQLEVLSIVNGARVTVSRNGTNLGTWRCWGHGVLIGLSPRFTVGETFEAEQRMCPGDPPSPTGSGTVQPCSALGAPGVHPVQTGDQHVHVTSFHPDAIIEVFVNLEQVGSGSGPIVFLTDPIEAGDVIHVGQVLGQCVGQTVLEIDPMCVAPPIGSDPSSYNIFPVGEEEYVDGDVHGIVFYPAEDDGVSTDFNERLASSGPVPVVFMVHGMHSPADPSYLGYRYLQRELARMGLIAVSVDQNTINAGGPSGVANIEARADLMIDNIAHFQGLNASPGKFFGRIDFSRVGLMGHSRGGDAVVTVPTVITLPGVSVRSVLALAPTNFRFWFGLPTIRPSGYAFMTILPAGDGDVRDNNGAQFYDQAAEVPYKSQVYVYNTNHNFFNREWLVDDGKGPPMLTRTEHERVLSTYASALYRDALMGHAGMIDYLSNHVAPSNARTDTVHLSFAWRDARIVDHHDENNSIDVNTLGGPTQQAGLVADEFAFHETLLDGLAPFNDSFHGQSLGMVIRPEAPNGTFRSELPEPFDLLNQEIWIRASEVYAAPLGPDAATFEIGLEDINGTQVFVSAEGVGGLPRPYDRRADDLADPRIGYDVSKTMPKTLRFPSRCFSAQNEELQLTEIIAILIRSGDERNMPVAFDDLHVVEKVW